jgi:hypothetical protein
MVNFHTWCLPFMPRLRLPCLLGKMTIVADNKLSRHPPSSRTIIFTGSECYLYFYIAPNTCNSISQISVLPQIREVVITVVYFCYSVQGVHCSLRKSWSHQGFGYCSLHLINWISCNKKYSLQIMLYS